MDRKNLWMIGTAIIIILIVLILWQISKIDSLTALNMAKSSGTLSQASQGSGMVGGC